MIDWQTKLAWRIGARLRAARLKQRMTLEYVSWAVPISIYYLSNIERGNMLPSIRVLYLLCVYYGEDIRSMFDDGITTIPPQTHDSRQIESIDL